MASGEDDRFSAIYTSIDEDEYEEYVEIISRPTPYLVPSQRGMLCSYKSSFSYYPFMATINNIE